MDDSGEFRTKVRNTLSSLYALEEAASQVAFRRLFRPYRFDLVILDMRLEEEREGLVVLREILAQDPLQPVIMVSAYGDTDAVLDAAEGGALMFLRKQEFTPELLARMVEAILQQARIRRQLASLQDRVRLDDPLSLTAGNSGAKRATRLVDMAANAPAAVVVVSGPTGAGHDLAAAAIHARSDRRSTAPFIILSGGPSQPLDLRRRLFGEPVGEGGSPNLKGALEEANWGILFIDRFDAMEPDLQDRVLRAVAERKPEGEHSFSLDLQLVLGIGPSPQAALAERIKNITPGTQVIELTLPSLRDRREDVPLLVAYFLQELRRQGRTSAQSFTKQALAALEAWDWPGNLHELKAVVGYAGVRALVDNVDGIERRHLPEAMLEGARNKVISQSPVPLQEILARTEAQIVADVIDHNPDATKNELAVLLGFTDRYALNRRVKKLLEQHPVIQGDFPMLKAIF